MTNEAFRENNFKELLETNPERQREIARAGGVASGISRRKKKQQNMIYGALLNVAADMDFSTPEERAEFKRWKKRQADNKRKRKERARKARAKK